MKEAIGLVAVILSLVAYAPYLRDIVTRRATPHPFSWLVWGLSAMLIFILQITHGGGAGAYTTATVALISLVVCAMALYYGGKADITKSDVVMLMLALVALALWLIADQPTLSMILLVTADMIAFVPSIRKTWRKPSSETLAMWSINGFRHGLSIVALQQYSLITLLDPVVWVICNFGFCIMVLYRRQYLVKRER